MTTMNIDAFEGLVGPHLDGLYRFACTRTKDPTGAEDLVQETLMRAWDRIGSLQDLGRVRAWLYTILVNLFRERSRKANRRAQLLPMSHPDAPLDELATSTAGSPLDEVIRRSAAEAVRAALARTPERYAVAVELRDLEGLSFKEIAAILGVPEGTAMSRVGRGRRIMAGLLAEWRDEASRPREGRHG